jgi:hypothetical protein
VVLSILGAVSEERTSLSFVAVIVRSTRQFCHVGFNTVSFMVTILSSSDPAPLSSVMIG